MFRRRTPRSYQQIAQDMIYPRGGWSRAGQYLLHRLRRLPDRPHRIGRGMAAGVFASCTPLFGVHIFLALALAWAMGGNLFAAVIGTFLGNPVTIPVIAVLSVTLGRLLLGVEGHAGPQAIIGELAHAGAEFGRNMFAPFTDQTAEWGDLALAWHAIVLPYLVGGALIGLVLATVTHYVTLSVIRAYQRRRLAGARARGAQAEARRGE